MGCNCKTQVINNLKSQQHLEIANEIYQRVVINQTEEGLSDFDYMELYQAYNILYPNSSAQPSKESLIEHIVNSLQFLKTKTIKK